MQKRDFETYQKRFRVLEILLKFSDTHVLRGTIRHSLYIRPNLENVYFKVALYVLFIFFLRKIASYNYLVTTFFSGLFVGFSPQATTFYAPILIAPRVFCRLRELPVLDPVYCRNLPILLCCNDVGRLSAKMFVAVKAKVRCISL